MKDDNFGTLERKVRDAFTLVNHNGKAFRDARITGEYLEARLDELRWAVVATELKAREREEQRVIKERIREEERAQRELEKARRDAEKEQETLRRAMEKARREVDKSGEAERAKLEEKLRELEGKLRVAEEKGQRALSMAQQTKAGTVYVISNVGSFGEDVFKIGMTRRVVPEDRVRELGDASVPFEFDVHALVRTNDAPALEHALHRRFVRNQVNKVNPRKEFFPAAALGDPGGDRQAGDGGVVDADGGGEGVPGDAGGRAGAREQDAGRDQVGAVPGGGDSDVRRAGAGRGDGLTELRARPGEGVTTTV